MVIMCEECGKKYRIDPTAMKGPSARFKCNVCGLVMTVQKPDPAAAAAESARADAAVAPPPPISAATSATAPSAPTPTPTSEPRPKAAPAAAPAATRGTGLTRKVVVLMLVVSLVPLAVFGAITFSRTSQHIRSAAQNLSTEIAGGLVAQVDEWVDKNVRVLKTLATTADIVSMDPKRQEPLLQAVQQQYPWMYLVFTVDARGMNIARSDGKDLRDYSDRDYYQNVRDGRELAWQTLIGKTSKKPALVLAVPIRDAGGRLVGVLANAMTVDDMSTRIATWRQGETGLAFLVDEQGKVVAHQDSEFVQEQRNLSDHPLVAHQQAGNTGSLAFHDSEGTAFVGQVQATQLGWALAIQQEEREAFQVLHQTMTVGYSVLGATVVVVLLIAVAASRAIVNPIRNLTAAADRISVGELDVQIDVRSRDEIGALAEAIARMQDSIRLSIERLRRRR